MAKRKDSDTCPPYDGEGEDKENQMQVEEAVDMSNISDIILKPIMSEDFIKNEHEVTQTLKTVMGGVTTK